MTIRLRGEIVLIVVVGWRSRDAALGMEKASANHGVASDPGKFPL